MTMLRLSNMANFLRTEQNLAAVAQHVAINACRNNQVCRVYIAQIESSFRIKHLASFGHEQDFIKEVSQFDLESMPALANTLRSTDIVIRQRDLEYERDFGRLSAGSVGKLQMWKSVVFLPMLPHFFVTLSFGIKVENTKENQDYFELLRSILSLYLHQRGGIDYQQQNLITRKRGTALGEKLTERQESILERVKQGMTNIAIANQLGYSESLIRQETILIYQKLGIDGRRELHNQS